MSGSAVMSEAPLMSIVFLRSALVDRSFSPEITPPARSSKMSGGRERSCSTESRTGAAQPAASTTATRNSALDDVPRFKILRHEYQLFHCPVKALLSHDDPEHRAGFDQVLVLHGGRHLEHPALVVVGGDLELTRAELIADLEVRQEVRIGREAPLHVVDRPEEDGAGHMDRLPLRLLHDERRLRDAPGEAVGHLVAP